MEPFNLTKISGRKRIKDRGINWKERYREKSLTLKKRYDKQIGQGAYRRWEGHDYTTNSDYYVVVGPTVQSDFGKCFFAGIKKLPKDPHKKVYSPSGEYFINIIAAYSHASNKWGVPFPTGQIAYTQAHLVDVKIPEHIKG